MTTPNPPRLDAIDKAIFGDQGRQSLTIGTVEVPEFSGDTAFVMRDGELVKHAHEPLGLAAAAAERVGAVVESVRKGVVVLATRNASVEKPRHKHSWSASWLLGKFKWALLALVVLAAAGVALVVGLGLGAHYATQAAEGAERHYRAFEPVGDASSLAAPVKIDEPPAEQVVAKSEESPTSMPVPTAVLEAADLPDPKDLPAPLPEPDGQPKPTAAAQRREAPKAAPSPKDQSPPTAQKAKDTLISLSEEASTGQGASGLGGPTKVTTTVEAKKAPSSPSALSSALSSASSAAAARAVEPQQQTRKLKYGTAGITALTGGGVIVVSREAGQVEIKVGKQLPDGSVVRGVDPKLHQITTDKGVIQME